MQILFFPALIALLYFSYDILGYLLSDAVTDLIIRLPFPESFAPSLPAFLDTVLSALFALLYALLAYLLFHRKNTPQKKPLVSLSRKSKLSLGVITGLGICGLSGLWFIAVELWLKDIPFVAGDIETFSHAFEDIEAGHYLFTLLSLVILGPLTEELLFRSLIFSSLERICARPWFPILVSGLLFGVWHGIFVQAVYASITGIVLGYIYYMTRDIRLTWLIHMVNNLNGTLPWATCGTSARGRTKRSRRLSSTRCGIKLPTLCFLAM